MNPGDTLYRLSDSPPMTDRWPSYEVEEWRVERMTAMTAFVRRVHCYVSTGPEKRMLINAKRPFAHATKEDAAQAYARRKFRHIEHARRSLTLARSRFEAVKRDHGIEMPEPDDEWFTLDHIMREDF